MSYAFTLADMRTYLSYLQTKKQSILFDQAADADIEEEEERDEEDTMPPDKKKKPDDDETFE